MKRRGTWSLGLLVWTVAAVVALLGLACQGSKPAEPTNPLAEGNLPNNYPLPNSGGEAATFSTRGFVALKSEFFKPQGTNGQTCQSCHIPAEAWSVTPATLQRSFDKTNGTDPGFSSLDANNPDMDVSTPEARRAAYSMMLTRGVFRRGGPPKADAEWELIAVEDPHGYANVNRLVHWRRSMPTTNFPVGSVTVNWDAASNIGKGQRAALDNLTTRLITGPMHGQPPTPEVVADIGDFETSLFTAQVTVPGVGRLDADGARGGPEELAKMTKAEGDFNLFDAWKDDPNPKRAQIARGQRIFNSMNPSHKSCIACHNSVNNGTSFDNTMFDINTASAAARTPDLPLYTFRNKRTGETRQLTDAGFGNITGKWDDLGLFKTPTLRGLAARPPYFHNGIAATLEDVVRHYEKHFGFVFTDEERADLVAFLNAL